MIKVKFEPFNEGTAVHSLDGGIVIAGGVSFSF